MDIIDNLKIELTKLDEVQFAYLFGSYSKNKQTDKSDIDIAVYLTDICLDTQLQVNYILSKRLNKDIDITLLNSAKNLYLLDNIFKNGIVLKENEALRFDFELKKEHDIFDFKESRKLIDAA
ncbi:MAG: nucleotidyltransferase domain-containing protein [Campylobacterota bacterium]|nr:nucleotidyltransferase domain-containing protein [Campylobacterota bacterium]